MNHPPTTPTVLSTQELIALATSGAIDQISNYKGAIKRYILGHGLVCDGRVERPLFFATYQTERYGPQNGFRLVLVYREFRLEDYDFAALEKEIAYGTVEFVALGTPQPPIEDPDPSIFE